MCLGLRRCRGVFFFFQAEDGIRDYKVTGVQTCALPISPNPRGGEIEHDGLGEPTGMLKENAAMSLVRVRIPDPTAEQRRKGIELVLQNVEIGRASCRERV